ncbi:MAG TPA: UDP-glucose/GDP-mannose dehydrogenase family protein [Kofleriaceae bacterium]|nr:UDP-glucose/GDP-mannose dehydrogenase family protein [Kofleriaceae bacterium]
MKLTVLGTGYVGLVVGAGFADFGHDVTCVDIDAARIARLSAGELPFHEPGLAELVARNRARGRLRFTTRLAEATPGIDAAFIAVGTPEGEDGSAELRHVLAAARALGPALTGPTVVVDKSTVPVGTAEQVRAVLRETCAHECIVVANPEFLKEGDAVNDFMKPARVVIGSDDPRGTELMRRLYAPLQRTGERVVLMDVRSAELTKYAANTMLATRISLMNELALVAEALGADIDAVRKALGADPRIGNKFLFAGPGFGGSCFPKDLRALARTARAAGVEPLVVDAVIAANQRQLGVLPAKVARRLGADLAGARIAVWGLAFKPETDDVRESPAFPLIDALLAAGATPVAYDPAASANAARRYGDRLLVAPTMYAAAEGADGVCLVTEWHELRRPDFARLRGIVRRPNLFDGRNVWVRAEVEPLGFHYDAIGRPA